jgi:hypothetical protein
MMDYVYTVYATPPWGERECFSFYSHLEAIELADDLREEGYTDVIIEEIRYY